MATRALVAFLIGVLGIILSITVVPGVFTIDELNYLVSVLSLGEGTFTVPGTEHLSPSPELAFFDPVYGKPESLRTPLAPRVPPLYAFLALPFSVLGWRGLVAANTIAFLTTIWIVYLITDRVASRRHTAPLAAITCAFGGYFIEYAQGMWPHMVSVSLCTAAFLFTVRVLLHGADERTALFAGLLVGVAIGVRYQNVLIAGSLFAAFALWSPRRARSVSYYLAGLALPLAACALINLARMNSLNPISKGSGYLVPQAGAGGFNPLLEALWGFAARVIDFRLHPPMTWRAFALDPHPVSGAYVFVGAVKKALLQSAPWVAMALTATLFCWKRTHEPLEMRDRIGRLVSLIVWPTLIAFSIAGFRRTDGFCFNQRYFLELLPLASVLVALELDRVQVRPRLPLAAALTGAGLATAALVQDAGNPYRHVLLSSFSLALALTAVVGCWLVRARQLQKIGVLAVGAAVAWSLAVHLGDDLPASRRVRSVSQWESNVLDPHLPDGAAVFTWGAHRNAAAFLLLNRTLLIVDAARDRGADAPRLLDQLLERHRTYVIPAGFEEQALRRLLEGRQYRIVLAQPVTLIEVTMADEAGANPPPPRPAAE